MLGNLVSSSDTKIDFTFPHERRNICSGKEDQGQGQVLDQRNVQPVVAVELDIGSREEVESRGVQSSLLRDCEEQSVVEAVNQLR